MRNIRLIIRYDGTKYNGWQKQGNTEQTIQGKMEQLLTKMTGESIELAGSGRTDAGVHALAQVANFHTHSSMTEKEMAEYMQEYLPKDIGIVEVKEVGERFHSLLNAVKKQYEYRIYMGQENPVFERKYCWHIQEPLNVEAIKKASESFIGQHDFTKGPFVLEAEQIKKACQNFKNTAEKEVQILCKQDSRESRPQIFKDNNLFILPKHNGVYYIVKR